MNEVTFEFGGNSIGVDGIEVIRLASGWVLVGAPRLVFERRGRKYDNAILEYTVDGGFGAEDRAVALDELSASEYKSAAIVKAASDFVSKRIGFSEFKRIVRENS